VRPNPDEDWTEIHWDPDHMAGQPPLPAEETAPDLLRRKRARQRMMLYGTAAALGLVGIIIFAGVFGSIFKHGSM